MNNTLNKYISQKTSDFLHDELNLDSSLYEINQKLENTCGIINFFEKNDGLNFLKDKSTKLTDREEKSEYGDYQTNSKLTDNVCNLLKSKKNKPNIIFEPTFGKGNFIISALKNFENIEKIYGIEIYKPYILITKLKI